MSKVSCSRKQQPTLKWLNRELNLGPFDYQADAHHLAVLPYAHAHTHAHTLTHIHACAHTHTCMTRTCTHTEFVHALQRSDINAPQILFVHICRLRIIVVWSQRNLCPVSNLEVWHIVSLAM